jgi:voltage-gated potassium channel
MTEQSAQDKNSFTALNILVLVLSVYILTALLIDTIFKLPIEISSVIELVDNCICVFFLFEFSVRFYQADNKLKFMKWG